MPRKVPPAAYAVLQESGTARRSLVNPFGTGRLRDWRMPEGGTPEGLEGAQLQHRVVRKVREALLQRDEMSIAEFTREHDEFTYERLRSLLAGDAWMRMEDLAALSRLLGLSVTIDSADGTRQ